MKLLNKIKELGFKELEYDWEDTNLIKVDFYNKYTKKYQYKLIQISEKSSKEEIENKIYQVLNEISKEF